MTGTNHSRGIQPADFELLLAKGAATVVLALGMNGRLLVAPATRRLLADRGVEAHITRAEEAVKLYNRLREEGPVGSLINSTC